METTALKGVAFLLGCIMGAALNAFGPVWRRYADVLGTNSSDHSARGVFKESRVILSVGLPFRTARVGT